MHPQLARQSIIVATAALIVSGFVLTLPAMAVTDQPLYLDNAATLQLDQPPTLEGLAMNGGLGYAPVLSDQNATVIWLSMAWPWLFVPIAVLAALAYGIYLLNQLDTFSFEPPFGNLGIPMAGVKGGQAERDPEEQRQDDERADMEHRLRAVYEDQDDKYDPT